MKGSDHFLKIVEWSEEDQCYVGTCPGLMLGGIHGNSETAVYEELCQAVEEWIEISQEDGETLPAATVSKEYSGKFVLRVGKDLYKALAIEALRHRESLTRISHQLSAAASYLALTALQAGGFVTLFRTPRRIAADTPAGSFP